MIAPTITGERMRKIRNIGVVTATLAVLVLGSAPASAYWITGWQTNGGWNRIDNCSVLRGIDNTRWAKHVNANDFLCARDVGVRGKGKKANGSSFEYGTISWDSSFARQDTHTDWKFTAMKVYHGNR